MKLRMGFKLTFLGLLMGTSAVSGSIPSSIWRTNDTSFFDMWNKKDLDTTFFWPHSTNWGVANPGTDSAMITTDGKAHSAPGWTNLVWKWQSDPMQKNFEIRFSYHMVENPGGNSGFNARGRCGTGTIANKCGGLAQGFQIHGPQIDLGPIYTGNIWNSGNNIYANAISECKLTGTLWQDLGYKVSNDTAYMLYYPNGFASPTTVKTCSKYKFTADTDVAATSPGIIAIQYETTLRIEFKNIKIRNLSATQAVSVLNPQENQIQAHLIGERHGISFDIKEAKKFSVKVTNLDGKIVRSLDGMGPAINQEIQLGQSGIFFVSISDGKNTMVRKVYAF